MILNGVVNIAEAGFLQLERATTIQMDNLEELGFSGLGYALLCKKFDLPKLKKIGSFALNRAGKDVDSNEPVIINIPLAVDISRAALQDVRNNSNTIITLPSKFNTDAEKNRIFGVTASGGGAAYDQITFKFV